MRSILKLLDQGLSGLSLGDYGTASDGVLNFISTGSTTVAGATLSGGVYTMTRDIYCADQSIVASGRHHQDVRVPPVLQRLTSTSTGSLT